MAENTTCDPVIERLSEPRYCFYGCNVAIDAVSITKERFRDGEYWKETLTYRFKCPVCGKFMKILFIDMNPIEPDDHFPNTVVFMTLDGKPICEEEEAAGYPSSYWDMDS